MVLRAAEDIMMRANIVLLMIDETARQMRDKEELTGDGIDVAIFQKNDTPSYKTAMQYAVGERHPERIEKTEWGYQLPILVEDKHIPLRIHVIKGHYDFLSSKSLDSRLYKYEYYWFPNPWKDYWEHRAEVL